VSRGGVLAVQGFWWQSDRQPYGLPAVVCAGCLATARVSWLPERAKPLGAPGVLAWPCD